MKHWETHPEEVEGCFACRIAGVSFSALATPTRHAGTVDAVRREQSFAVDSEAYRRLRKNKVQPKNINGAAMLEKGANSVQQIEGVARRPKAKRI